MFCLRYPVNPLVETTRYGWHAYTYCAFLSVSWAISLSCWVISLQYTWTSRASLVASTYPLMLVFFLKLSGVACFQLVKFLESQLHFLVLV